MMRSYKLPYHSPFNYRGLLHIYEMHQVGKLEKFSDNKMYRIIEFNNQVGTIVISNDERHSELLLEIDFPDSQMDKIIIERVRKMFDLDIDPQIISEHLNKHSSIKKILKKHPGIRAPSGWDSFEVAIATILGQLVSVERGKALTADLIEIAGVDSGIILDGRVIKLFPTPEDILKSDLAALKTTNARKDALKNLSQALVNNELSLNSDQHPEDFIKNVLKIKGIGKWTADYMALKVLRDTDSFPSTDLILARTFDMHPEEVISQLSPWRGYVAALFWREYSAVLTKKKIKK